MDIIFERETNDGENYSLEKRTKLNNSKQHKKCVDSSAPGSKRSALLVFDALDFRGTLLKQTLRVANLRRLKYAEIIQLICNFFLLITPMFHIVWNTIIM